MSYRIEKKLFIQKENFFEFKKKLIEKGAKKIFKDREINSLYFDNFKKEMFHDSLEGLTPRKKIRVRNYPKEFNKRLLFETKISSVEGRFKTNKLINERYLSIITKNGIFDSKYGICKPILNVNYNREYFKMGDVRITLDSNIFYELYNGRFIKKDLRIVAELKTSIDKNLDELAEIYPFQEIRFSKYCNGIELFNKG